MEQEAQTSEAPEEAQVDATPEATTDRHAGRPEKVNDPADLVTQYQRLEV